ncbi:hypothetical protein Q8F55_005858 [Vanrija albida]|uniref:BRCT domain-containing protein n=1 Tax=Vanrija albida TaxID=181172 RepID=A0ABR3Q2R9_9TREE
MGLDPHACGTLARYLEECGLPLPSYTVYPDHKTIKGIVHPLFRCRVTLPVYPFMQESARQSTEQLAKTQAAQLACRSHGIGEEDASAKEVASNPGNRVDQQRFLSTQPGGRYPGEGEAAPTPDNVFAYRGAALAFHVPSGNKEVVNYIIASGGELVARDEAMFHILDSGVNHLEADPESIQLLDYIKKRHIDHPAVVLSSNWVYDSILDGKRRPVEQYRIQKGNNVAAVPKDSVAVSDKHTEDVFKNTKSQPQGKSGQDHADLSADADENHTDGENPPPAAKRRRVGTQEEA